MNPKRGRKTGSKIRDNIALILFYCGDCYGYEVYKKYLEVFGRVNIRSIYYNLNKGCDLGVFGLKTVEIIQGDFSWGMKTQRNIFSLIDKKGIVPDEKVKNRLK